MCKEHTYEHKKKNQPSISQRLIKAPLSNLHITSRPQFFPNLNKSTSETKMGADHSSVLHT
jgi:hypothetical protein